ncbi:hypothetical protein [Haloechinothrix sp. LS1_15]|uniref:hypothetical protein n=1 Tax=Haloechinothrix sp. LS1_15 TaxID=2652248 RepID=UPI0029466A7F|nr:hypothetical protein [Haloechinothrix sp. LS1_15]MDV6012327.1 hypothetical protein [Haloechinothrix sp. LS1_15]
MSERTRFQVRWLLRIIGGLLIVVTFSASFYARFGGEQVGEAMVIPAGDTDTRFLVTSSGPAEDRQCTVRSPGREAETIELPPTTRATVRGEYLDPPASGIELTCAREDVQVTSGPMLSLYSLFWGKNFSIVVGVILIAIGEFWAPPRSR